MFLRKKRKKSGGEVYEYWSLCETVRTAKGPRQRVVASLCKLDEKDVRGGGWEDIEGLLSGTPSAKAVQPRLGEHWEAAPAARWEKVDVGALKVERVREFGEVYLPLALWHRLGLGKLLKGLIEAGREKVGWEMVASVLVVARFCSQRSELGIAEGWYEKTALEDVLGVEKSRINDDRLYRALDVLGEHKEKLCAHLIERYRDWFGVRMEFLLYDVTSTFFEGSAAKNPKAQRGYSRDNRPDCKQVCIGLVCTPEGLPLSYEVFNGNRVDVTTVEDIVRMMEEKYGTAERVWVMDRGMVSEANMAFLRERKALYIVGTPKSELRHFEAALLDEENWTEVQDGLEARMVEHPDGNGSEKYVLCRSTARAEKERAMLERQSQSLATELAKIQAWLLRSPQEDLEKVGRRIGRALGKYPAAARILEARVEQDTSGRACDLVYYQSPGSRSARSPQSRSLSSADQLPGNRSGHHLALVYPAHLSGGRVPNRQKRSGTAPHLPSLGIPGRCPHLGLLPGSRPLALLGTMDARQGPGLLCPQTHRISGHHQEYGRHPARRTQRTAHRVATPGGRQARIRCGSTLGPPRPPDSPPIQNYRKCSAENRVKIPLHPHKYSIGPFKLRNLG